MTYISSRSVATGLKGLCVSFKNGLFVVVLTLSFVTLSYADVFEDGLSAFGGANYDKAMLIWKPLAESGNAAAQYYMGVMYANGQGVEKDFIKAYAWYSVAAVEQDMAEENRDDIAEQMSGAQIERAKKLAQEFVIRFASR